MKKHNIIFGSISMVLVLAASLFAQDVKTDYDRSANFGQYKTYSWDRVQTEDPLWVNRVKNAVDASLTAKGWRQVASGGDVYLTAMGVTRNEQTLNTYYDRFGGRRFGGFGEATTTTDVYKVGTLVVDMFDAQTKKLIWRGSSSDTVSSKSDKNIKNLDKGVQKMFKHFPPETDRG
jgi:Domain of unknown function (DUF4136)